MLHPLRFEPVFRRYLWGGRRLATELGKEIGSETCAESWEVVDRHEANSIVVEGEFAGCTLHDLIVKFGPELLGAEIHEQITSEDWPVKLRGRFPLLLKFLDAHKTLSVQVHPDDHAALARTEPDLGKTEAWYVMEAQPGSLIYAGLKEGVDCKALRQAVLSKTTDQVLNSFEPKTGDAIFVPAGTVHAIGEGLLIAEIQQSSDTTYRLFDWNRVDTDGRSRDLHVEQALAVTDFDRGPVFPQDGCVSSDSRVSDLITCDKFRIRRWALDHEVAKIETLGRFRLIMATSGSMRIEEDPDNFPMVRGQTMMVPASLDAVNITASQPGEPCEFLEISVPTTD